MLLNKQITLGIISSDLNLTTKFIEKIINNTNAKRDQDHIKMDIIINNNLLNKTENELDEFIKRYETMNITHLCLYYPNQKMLNTFSNHFEIPIYCINNLKKEEETIKTITSLCNKKEEAI